ncbi:NADH dehydrogenase [ubiquinone] 1 alpha subcomplex subunit 3-like [Orcinus orca]|uniref:NADH dehydrogenase [ubiquinone] 1 alpha subcomplex subunit 3-like n=1 Tax=Orcinus orca TaxID=9733 RepID=UPI002112A690|nr:NADH dehydrogenase [ubiquinone] 1 alpha subcomplex subunit 3-like [Orcinus orca]
MAAVSFVCQRGPEADSHVSEYEADRTPVKPSDDPSPNQQESPCEPADLNWGSQGNCKTPSFLKNAWAKELVLVVSFTIGGLIIILPTISPCTKYAIMINQASPYNHTVLLLDHGNITNGSSHSQDPQGPSLEWLKKL